MGKSRKRTAPNEQFLREGRALVLAEAEAMYHSLGCRDCGLRSEALIALALVGWTEDEFVLADMAAHA